MTCIIITDSRYWIIDTTIMCVQEVKNIKSCIESSVVTIETCYKLFGYYKYHNDKICYGVFSETLTWYICHWYMNRWLTPVNMSSKFSQNSEALNYKHINVFNMFWSFNPLFWRREQKYMFEDFNFVYIHTYDRCMHYGRNTSSTFSTNSETKYIVWRIVCSSLFNFLKSRYFSWNKRVFYLLSDMYYMD